MRLLLSLVWLLFGMSICACAHLGNEEDSNYEHADDYELNTIQEEADGGDDDYDGEDDDDDDGDDDQKNEDAMATSFALPSNNLATGLAVRPASTFTSGDTITIQLVANPRLHVGCFGGHMKCGADPCPGLYFDPADYGKCRGEVFQIYRAAGAGPIKTGDVVGFYYPLKQRWIRANHQTDLAPCPGVPRNPNHRINPGCFMELYQIYARGKGIGQSIDQLDHVMIHYPRSKTFLQYPHAKGLRHGLTLSTCPGQCLPPHSSTYERCSQNVFTIRKKM